MSTSPVHPTPANPPAIHVYSLTSDAGPSAVAAAREILRPRLPASIALYRRLQFGHFFASACLLSSVELGGTGSVDADDGNGKSEEELVRTPWAMAFVDRSCRPETEAYLHGSWERSPPAPAPAREQARIEQLLLALLRAAKRLPVAAAAAAVDGGAAGHAGAALDAGGLSRDDYAAHATNPAVLLLGAGHEATVPVLQRLDVLAPRRATRPEFNYTYLFRVAGLAAAAEADRERHAAVLEQLGLQWGELRPRDFEVVRARTMIPRQDRTLTILPNLGLFARAGGEAEAPVAWAFVGLDGSLTSLHVETQWRGKGLAKMLTSKLIREKMDRYWEEGVDRVAHGYVMVENVPSQKMCESLGAKSGFECVWMTVDLGRV